MDVGCGGEESENAPRGTMQMIYVSKIFEFDDYTWYVDYGLSRLEVTSATYQSVIEKLHRGHKWYFVEDADYSGDFFACGIPIYNKDEYLFIQGSFGSCSGCDWLYSIKSVKEAEEFLNHFKKEVIRKKTRQEIIEYMKGTIQNVHESKTLMELIKQIEALCGEGGSS